MISEQGVLLLPPWGRWRSHSAGPTLSRAFLFQVSAAGAVDRLSTQCLARITAWTRASWLWPSPDKPKVVLTGWGREGAGRTSVLCKDSLLFAVQIFGRWHFSGPASVLPVIIRKQRIACSRFFGAAFLDQLVEPTLEHGSSYSNSSWRPGHCHNYACPRRAASFPLPGLQQRSERTASPSHKGCSIQRLHKWK